MSDASIRSFLQASLGESYILGRELGGGGMATVFVAEETTLGRQIVVKVLPPEMAAELSLARFHREITLAARLQHPHIVPLLSAGETHGLPYYTMPFVDGETLRERITRLGEMPIAEAVRLLREIATAIAYAHEAGIVHRDIKPENILLSGDVALITDFGVAKAVLGSGGERLTTAGIAVGTPAYMSPEQVGADPAVDHRADIYALGVVAYEMLTGHAPFVGRNVQALLAAHVMTEPESIAKRRAAIPPALATLVMQCLAKRPADRPQQATDIVRTLDSMTVSAPAIIGPRRTIVPRFAGIAGASVLIAATAVWFFASRSKTPTTSTAASRILIAPFENLTGDPRLDNVGHIAADRLTQIVAQGARIDVVPSTTVLMSLRDTTGGTAERIRRLTSAMRVGLLATGTIVRRGDSLTLQMQVTDLRTGKIVIAVDPARGTESDPIAALDALGDRLLGALGGREVTLLSNDVRAPTNAAYQEFSKGFERFTMYNDNFGSRPYFVRAIALDSTYVRAYQLLTRQYLNANEFARADSMVQRIDRLPQGLTAVERILNEYSKAELRGDLAGLLRTQQAMVAIDSSPVSVFLIGEAANGLLRPRLSIPALEVAVVPYAMLSGQAYRGAILHLAEAYHEGGQHDRELRTLSERRAAFDDITVFRGRELRAYGAIPQTGAAALALVDTMLQVTSDSSGALLERIATAAAEFRAHGDPRTAAQMSAKARAWIDAHPARTPTPSRLLQEGLVLAANGMHDSAITRFANVARTENRMDAAGYHALSLVARGDRDRARAIADSLGALNRPWMFGANTFWRGAILGALGEREAAVQLLRQAHLEGQWMETWHYTPALETLHGYAPFEALVRPAR